MAIFAEVDHVSRSFPLPNGDRYLALANIDLKIRKGEFISLVGHSGCGKSTLLNIIAGLDQPTEGGIVLEGRQVKEPGPDRMVVFQNYSLLPWLTVRENIALGVNATLKHLSEDERRHTIDHHIDLVGLRLAANKKPGQLSGGMKQRVAIARALAVRPRLLLLDEPFGALDALTRGGLQEQLMAICRESEVTCIMVTHDVDEALLLSDRIVLLTNGPGSYIGQIMDVPFHRPRSHVSVAEHPNYYSLRSEIVYFLNQQRRAKRQRLQPVAAITSGDLEKINLSIGFIPLTDCAPLVVAQEMGFFAKHGLTQVSLQREPSWEAISNGIRQGRLDAAQMVAGMPMAMTLGMRGAPSIPMTTGLTLSRNGNAITLHRRYLEAGVRSLEDLKAYLDSHPGEKPTLAMVHVTSMHNLILRYWLAAGGIDPDRDVQLITIAPAQMVANLRAGSIDGYCVGEPWNAWAVAEGIGYVIALDQDIWPGHCEKVLGVRQDWAETHPETHIALIQALLEACQYCDHPRHREGILDLICRPEYVGVDRAFIRPGFIDPYHRGIEGEEPQWIYRFHQFFVDRANCPDRTEALWIMAQLARWDITPFPRNWIEVVDQVRQMNTFVTAAQGVGMANISRDRGPITLFDGVPFNPDDPIRYLQELPIKGDYRIQEISLTPVASGAVA